MKAAETENDLATIVTGRFTSLFSADLVCFNDDLEKSLKNARILVIGGAGSIGSATVMALLAFRPSVLHVVDNNENSLAELVRDVRNHDFEISAVDFRAIPIDFGGPIMHRFLVDEPAFDIVFNFAALKHVRSEKDVYSLLQMLDTNVVRQFRFKSWLVERGGCSRYFAVSTDKAANPTSLMGASKRMMEDVIFDYQSTQNMTVTSARFANVAFSNGSLLKSFIRRLALRQPLAAPRDTRRYFVSENEASHICLLAGLLGKSGYVYYPDMDPGIHLQRLEDVAADFLREHGFEAEIFEDESNARDSLETLAAERRWPLILTSIDTSGEKPYEEFRGIGEREVKTPFESLLALRHAASGAAQLDTYKQIENLINSYSETVQKAEFVDIIRKIVPNFKHVETGQSLDQRA